MISEEDALVLARRHIESTCRDVAGGVEILREHTIRKPYGWVFFYDSRRFLETSNPLHALGGNGPVLIDMNGSVHQLGTGRSLEDLLAEFEKR